MIKHCRAAAAAPSGSLAVAAPSQNKIGSHPKAAPNRNPCFVCQLNISHHAQYITPEKMKPRITEV